ncbi:RHS repeat-associated core domain-containing protein [Pseudomonas syringae]|uniref:RHS repeat-associated core domain-containing protein n=1 Tax=Pseudomonas syringae TaxID=317 RepID=UPI000AD7DE60|nr:RHS repeat-associated core domain-containing protein [Pseudomonas syringae]
MNNSTLLCRYAYDPLDRLAVRAQVGASVSQCFYQAGRLHSEVQASARRTLIRHGRQVMAQIDERDGIGNQYLLATDRQHSVVHAAGPQSQQAIAYSPYGHRPAENGLTQLPGFSGERVEPFTGYYMLGNGYRSFNPVLMRFNSPDTLSPFGKGGLNAYAYCLGDPVNYQDPNGHIPWWVGLAAGVAAFVLTAGIAAPLTAAMGVSMATAGAVAAVATKVSIAATVISVGSAAGSAMTKGGLSEGLGWLSLGTGVVAGAAGGLAIGAKMGSTFTAGRSIANLDEVRAMRALTRAEQRSTAELDRMEHLLEQTQNSLITESRRNRLNISLTRQALDWETAETERLFALEDFKKVSPPPAYVKPPPYKEALKNIRVVV